MLARKLYTKNFFIINMQKLHFVQFHSILYSADPLISLQLIYNIQANLSQYNKFEN